MLTAFPFFRQLSPELVADLVGSEVGMRLATTSHVSVLGPIPIDNDASALGDKAEPIIFQMPECNAGEGLKDIIIHMIRQ